MPPAWRQAKAAKRVALFAARRRSACLHDHEPRPAATDGVNQSVAIDADAGQDVLVENEERLDGADLSAAVVDGEVQIMELRMDRVGPSGGEWVMKLRLYLHLLGLYFGTLCVRFCVKCKKHPESDIGANRMNAPRESTASRGIALSDAAIFGDMSASRELQRQVRRIATIAGRISAGVALAGLTLPVGTDQ